MDVRAFPTSGRIFIFGFLSAIAPLSIDIYLPALPMLRQALEPHPPDLPLGHRGPARIRGALFLVSCTTFPANGSRRRFQPLSLSSALSDTAPASVAKSVATPLASIRKHLQRFGFRSLVDGSDGEHYLAAALAHRRWVLVRQIGDRLHASAKHTSACGSILRPPQQIRQLRDVGCH
jgi:hypothetical protein